MSIHKILIVLSLCAALATARQAAAQTCPNPVAIGCNQAVNGDTTGSASQTYEYSCDYSDMDGPEDHYLLELQGAWHVQVDIDGDFDTGIYILNQSGGDCDPMDCVVGDDAGITGESIEADLTAGTYYIAVDGYNASSEGTYLLTVSCDTCVDGDNDGYLVQDPNCPAGNDCDDTAASVHPNAGEICADGIDQNCDGDDPPCPYCESLGPIDCDTEIAANNGQVGSTDLVSAYTCLPYAESSTEVAWTFSPDFSGNVRIRLNSTSADLALAVIPGDGPCAGHLCAEGADRIFGPGEEILLIEVSAGETYYVVVDGWSTSQDDFTLIIDCAGCTDADQDGHGDYLCGGADCDDSDAAINPGAEELCDLVDNDCDGQTDEGFELAVDPGHCGDCFTACDAAEVCDLGSCASECSAALQECNGGCYDTGSDLRHCGSCDNPCEVPNAINDCQAGSCVVGDCLTNFGDCNVDSSDGCETDLLTSLDYCGACDGQPCAALPNAEPACNNGVCGLGACLEGYSNCNGLAADGCETPTATNTTHCGSCGNGCAEHEFCVAGACTNQCPNGLDNCAGVCMDTSEDPRNCGGCGRVCQFANASEPACLEGLCVLGTCEDGYGDCNDDTSDGCEETLGTLNDCLACDDACAYAHAKGICREAGCGLDVCDYGWTNCNQDDADGCETNTSGDMNNCGLCGHTCEFLEVCVNGACVVGCDDLDQDGFADAACGGTDCDDADDTSYPGADEQCDTRDNDCDGVADEGFDSDSDGYLDGSRCLGEDLDCDDTKAAVHPGATEICGDGTDQDCNGQDVDCNCPDADRDGAQDQSCGGQDCNDQNYDIHPNAQEICNDLDDDCDDLIDEGVCSGKKGCDCTTVSRSPADLLALIAIGLFLFRRRSR